MNLFFDIDYTIVSQSGTLRPRVREVFEQLKKDGHTIYIWSGLGVRPSVVEKHELTPYVSGVFGKPVHTYAEIVRGMLERKELPVWCEEGADAVELVLRLGLEGAQNRVH